MARKTKIVVIETDNQSNRDRNKAFLITEMGAFQGDAWAKRTLITLAKVDIDFGSIMGIENAPMQAIATLGCQIFGSIPWDDAKPLLDELMSCVTFIPDPTQPKITRAIGLGGSEDIEEVFTISYLQREVFNLHVNFSEIAAALKSMISQAAQKVESLRNM